MADARRAARGLAALGGARSDSGDERSWAKMAAVEGPAGDGEPWQSWLPNHAVFLRLREGLKSQSPAEAEKPACSPSPSPPPLTRNLVLGLGGELFLWDADDSSFLVVRLRGLGGAGEEPSLSQYQVRPSAGAARARGRRCEPSPGFGLWRPPFADPFPRQRLADADAVGATPAPGARAEGSGVRPPGGPATRLSGGRGAAGWL